MEILPDYRPLSKEKHKKINDMWAIYRESVGFEAEMYHDLKTKGIPEDNIRLIMVRHKESVKGNLDAWHELRQENI